MGVLAKVQWKHGMAKFAYEKRQTLESVVGNEVMLKLPHKILRKDGVEALKYLANHPKRTSASTGGVACQSHDMAVMVTAWVCIEPLLAT
ncbi:hypothetical protein SLA2020_335910 [Shorea laevis]